jgi:hypothetical protein
MNFCHLFTPGELRLQAATRKVAAQDPIVLKVFHPKEGA